MTVIAGRHARPSAAVLAAALLEAGYDGPPIRWGTQSGNKRAQKLALQEAEVSTPTVYLPDEGTWALAEVIESAGPIIGRRDYHSKGRGFFVCRTEADYQRTRRFRRPPTHYTRFIDIDREFRVHVVDGHSIKLQEKLGGDEGPRNFESGWRFMYPRPGIDRRQLRALAKAACAALDLEVGAVDIALDSSGTLYVLEVNTAPCLTSQSDTLGRYVRAFMERT